MKDFKKKDLIDGKHVVRYRYDNYKIVISGSFVGSNSWSSMAYYNEDLTSSNNTSHDVMSVYECKEKGTLTDYVEGRKLTLIWERTEKSAAQIEMDALKLQMVKLQKAIDDE